MGRTTYDNFATIWPGRSHPWAQRLNTIRKYVFSSTLERADWTNSTIIRGDVAAEVSRLKQQDGGNLLVFGHGQLTETLLENRLVDVLDLSGFTVQPVQNQRQARSRCDAAGGSMVAAPQSVIVPAAGGSGVDP